MPTLERTLAYAARRREAFNRGDPRIKLVVDEPLPDLEKAKNIVREAVTRAEKARTRKRNAKTRTKRAATKKRFSPGALKVAEVLRSDPKAGVTPDDIASTTKLQLGTVYAYLRALDAYSNGKGRWWTDKKTYLANFPIAGKKKKTGGAIDH
jgi:hypothetical protein